MVVLALAAGCGGLDGGRSPVDAAPLGPSFKRPVGEACDEGETPFCAFGSARCFDAVCRAFCSPVDYPRCVDGFREEHRREDGADLCVCVPE